VACQWMNPFRPDCAAIPSACGRCLINLINNAIKFTEKGDVLIRAGISERSENGVVVRFDVRDTGIGIPVQRQDRLFKMFSQVDASTSAQTAAAPGLGVGHFLSGKRGSWWSWMGGCIGRNQRGGKRAQPSGLRRELDLGIANTTARSTRTRCIRRPRRSSRFWRWMTMKHYRQVLPPDLCGMGRAGHFRCRRRAPHALEQLRRAAESGETV